MKAGGYFEANKQFIAPLPIPFANPAERATVASGAQSLQAAHSRRRDLLARLARRLQSTRSSRRPKTWLFPSLVTKRDRLADAPASLDAAAAVRWAAERYKMDVDAAYERLGTRLKAGVALDAEIHDGELSFLVEGIAVVDKIFVTAQEASFLLAQWKVIASTFSITEKPAGKNLEMRCALSLQ